MIGKVVVSDEGSASVEPFDNEDVVLIGHLKWWLIWVCLNIYLWNLIYITKVNEVELGKNELEKIIWSSNFILIFRGIRENYWGRKSSHLGFTICQFRTTGTFSLLPSLALSFWLQTVSSFYFFFEVVDCFLHYFSMNIFEHFDYWSIMVDSLWLSLSKFPDYLLWKTSFSEKHSYQKSFLASFGIYTG